MIKKMIQFVKKETVLVIAAVLAAVSMIWVKPSADYITYIDFRVLGILLSLMIVMAGFQKNGLFDSIGGWLLQRTGSVRNLCLVLVFLCFFSSMLITNDVALLTFVPFAMLTLKNCGKEELLIPVIVSQTIAANLGSMLTPLGNPQNLFLYHLAGYDFVTFVKIMFPYSLIAGILLFLGVIIFCRKENTQGGFSVCGEQLSGKKDLDKDAGRKNIGYLVLFVLCLLVVAKIMPYELVLAIVLVVVCRMDASVLKNVDYCLIFTFVFFFIFTGNLGKVSAMREFLAQMVTGREAAAGILSSQLISNVPAALLLSGFCTNYEKLLIGVNLGGLGTLIASMASLISYKIYAHAYNETKGRYFMWFTVANVVFLAVLVGAEALLA